MALQVQSRDLFATISDPSNSSSSRASKIVTFSDDPEPYLSHETVQRVTAAIERAKRLESAWSDEGDRMEQGKDFVTKVRDFPFIPRPGRASQSGIY